jgi:hypothetical protein
MRDLGRKQRLPIIIIAIAIAVIPVVTCVIIGIGILVFGALFGVVSGVEDLGRVYYHHCLRS